MSLFSFLFAAKAAKDTTDAVVNAGEKVTDSAAQSTENTFLKVGEELKENPKTTNQIWVSLIFRSQLFYLFLAITFFVPILGIIGVLFFLFMTRYTAKVYFLANEERIKQKKEKLEAEQAAKEAEKEAQKTEEERIEEIVQARLEEERQKEQEVE